jgi:alanine racemase
VTLRLTVDASAFQDHVDRVVRRHPRLVPVVKGNGYGFGRTELAARAARLADTIAVGTVHELDGLPSGVAVVVLTPTRRPPTSTLPILTVGSPTHVAALAGWPGRVLVKLASSMRRYGATVDELGAVTAAVRAGGLEIAGFSIHPPLVGTDDEHVDDIAAWLTLLEERDEVWVSHLSAAGYAALRDAWPDRRFRIRLGTALWHGEKEFLHLGADVLDTRPVRAGQHAGYRQVVVPYDGELVMVGAGTAHGVHPLPDGRSPFHFAHRRLALLEPPHMHTSMLLVPAGEIAPGGGDAVDVQRPLTTTLVDEVSWR